jgi:hypothetical protein
MTSKAVPPPVPLDVFEAIVNALLVAIAEAGLATCHGYNDRERLAERFERAAEHSLPPSPHGDAMKSLLRAVAAIVQNPESKPQTFTIP